MYRVHQYINGETFTGNDNSYFTTYNPATNEPIAEVQHASQRDVDTAVNSCKKGFEIWSAMTAKERSVILLNAARILRERNSELASLEV